MKSLKFIILILTTLILSCEKNNEDIIKEEVNLEYKRSIELLSFKNINNKRQVEERLVKLSRIMVKDLDRNDSENDELLNFNVITDYVKYIEQGNYHTYTFAVIRNNPVEGIQENILLELQEDGSYRTYLVRYHMTEEEFIAANSQDTILQDTTVEYILLDDDELDLSGSLASRCYISYEIVVTTWFSTSCGCWFASVEMDNISFSDGCYSSSGGGASGTGGSGSGGGNPVNNPGFGSGMTSPTGITNVDGSSSPLTNLINDLNAVKGPNDYFVFDDSLNASNTIDVNTVSEFLDYKYNVTLEPLDVTEVQPGTFETKFRVLLGVTTINISLNQKLKDASINQEYQVLSLDTNYTGVTIGSTWNQTSYSWTVVGNEAIITLHGTIDYDLFLNGIGTIFTDSKTYEMKVNILSGQPVSILEIEN